jgi:hypothetical protein
MEDKKLLEVINSYFDGELEKGQEPLLFTQLSLNSEAREYFKQLNKIKTAVEESLEEFPEELDERILRSIGSSASLKPGLFSSFKIFSAIPYAAAMILLFLSGYLFFKVSSFQERVDNLSQHVTLQSKTIQMLYNSLPGIEVRATFDNEIIVKPKI